MEQVPLYFQDTIHPNADCAVHFQEKVQQGHISFPDALMFMVADG